MIRSRGVSDALDSVLVMGNTNSRVRHLRDVVFAWKGGLGEGAGDGAGSRAGEDAPCVSPALQVPAVRRRHVGSDVVACGGDVVSVEQEIENSKSHWSELTEYDSGPSDKDLDAENWEVFKALRVHPTWGRVFFRTFGYDFGGYQSDGSLEIGEKFAEGGQAELFHAIVDWQNPKFHEVDLEYGREWLIKVFKKGTPLKHLQAQWPHGMLQFHVEEARNWESPTPKLHRRYYCAVDSGILLEDGRFAFLMEKEDLDLRTFNDRQMMTSIDKNHGPFSKEVYEEMMFCIALGMSWLHSRNIVHRDLKASNVLIKVTETGDIQCFVADYECSIGVVGMGFFRAPEILKACKDKSVSKRQELFSKSSDVYSYGMTCYEILTGKLPFDGELIYNYVDCVINGKRLEAPKYVDAWIESLLRDCWRLDPSSRPSFEDVVHTIFYNPVRIRSSVEAGFYKVDEMDWITWR